MRDRIPAAILTAAILLAPLAVAQEEEPRREPPVALNFAGGTLTQFVAAVRKASGGVNIVTSHVADSVRLPTITLKNASVYSALESVAKIVAPPYSVRVDINGNPDTQVFSVRVWHTGQTQTVQTLGSESADSRVEVFSLAPLTEPLATDPESIPITVSPQTVLTAIEAGLSVTVEDDPKKRRATMRYHEESKLLFVRGSILQISLVRATIQSLLDDVEERRKAAYRADRDRSKSNRTAPDGETK